MHARALQDVLLSKHSSTNAYTTPSTSATGVSALLGHDATLATSPFLRFVACDNPSIHDFHFSRAYPSSRNPPSPCFHTSAPVRRVAMASSKRDRLRLGIALGTGYTRINGQHLRGDDNADDTENRALSIKGRYDDPSIKQIAVYHEDGTVVYGAADVDKLITDNPDDRELQDKAMELWRIALHPEFQHLDEVKHVNDGLKTEEDRGSLQEFLRDQLQCIFRDVRVFYHKHPNFNSGEDETYWNTIPLELQISVPAMWGDDQQQSVLRMRQKQQRPREVYRPRGLSYDWSLYASPPYTCLT